MRFTSTLVLAISALASLVAAATTTSSGENPITYPLGGSIKAGSDVTITWSVTSGTSCDLVLRRGKDTDLDEILDIATSIPNTGAFTWSVSPNIPAGSDYSIQIAAGDNDNYSPMFAIESDVTSSSSTSASSTSTSSKSSSSSSSSSSSNASSTTLPTSTTLSTSTTASTTVSTSATATAANTSTIATGSSNSSAILSTTRAASSATPEATVVAANVNSGAHLASPLALVMCIFAGLMYLN